MAERTKGIAGLLAFFLGFLGAHRFYVGRDHSSLWYLVPTGIAVIGLLAAGAEVREADAWEDVENTWTLAFLAFQGLAAVIVLASWAEAIRFWAMNPVRFRRLYVAWVEPTSEGVQRPLPPEESRSKGVAIVLALLLGWLGVHRFYLHRPRSGVVLLLLALVGLAALGLGAAAEQPALLFGGAGLVGVLQLLGLIDAVRLGFVRERDFRHRYGTEAGAGAGAPSGQPAAGGFTFPGERAPPAPPPPAQKR